MLLLAVWITTAVAVLVLQIAAVTMDPSGMPGGGKWAIVLRAIAWPVLLVAAIIGAIFHWGDPGNWPRR